MLLGVGCISSAAYPCDSGQLMLDLHLPRLQSGDLSTLEITWRIIIDTEIYTVSMVHIVLFYASVLWKMKRHTV